MQDINSRIKEVIKKFCEDDVKLFANNIRVSPNTLYSIVGKRNSKPSYIVLAKIVTRYREVDPFWLLTGKTQ